MRLPTPPEPPPPTPEPDWFVRGNLRRPNPPPPPTFEWWDNPTLTIYLGLRPKWRWYHERFDRWLHDLPLGVRIHLQFVHEWLIGVREDVAQETLERLRA